MNQGGKGVELVKRNILVHKLDVDSPTWGGARFLPSTESHILVYVFKVTDLAIRAIIAKHLASNHEVICD